MSPEWIAQKVYHGRDGNRTPDPTLCAEGVSRDWSYYQCSRPGVVEEGGHKWCRQHAPSVEDEREAKRTAKWRAQDALAAARDAADHARRAIASAALAADPATLPPAVREAVAAYRAVAPAPASPPLPAERQVRG